MNRKKQNLPLRLEAPLKSKGATLPTPFDYGGDENAVKGRDERQRTAPLTAFSSRRRRVSFLRLTTALVVIDKMTGASWSCDKADIGWRSSPAPRPSRARRQNVSYQSLGRPLPGACGGSSGDHPGSGATGIG